MGLMFIRMSRNERLYGSLKKELIAKGCTSMISNINNAWGRTQMHTQFWCGNVKENRPLVRPRCTWEDDTEMDLGGTGWEHAGWMHLTLDGDKWQDLANTIMNTWVLYNAGKFLTSSGTISF
jgi:hypothetical protein